MSIEEITQKIKVAIHNANPYLSASERNGRYTLADVLYAIHIKDSNRFYQVVSEGFDISKCDYDGKKPKIWDLKRDQLDDQNDTVKLYIYELIK